MWIQQADVVLRLGGAWSVFPGKLVGTRHVLKPRCRPVVQKGPAVHAAAVIFGLYGGRAELRGRAELKVKPLGRQSQWQKLQVQPAEALWQMPRNRIRHSPLGPGVGRECVEDHNWRPSRDLVLVHRASLRPLDLPILPAWHRTLASHQGEPGLIPGRVPGFPQVGIVPDDIVGRRLFTGISCFPCPLITETSHRTLHTTNYDNVHEKVHQSAKSSIELSRQAVVQACNESSKESSIVAYPLLCSNRVASTAALHPTVQHCPDVLTSNPINATFAGCIGKKAVRCWDTEIGWARPARSVYLIFSLRAVPDGLPVERGLVAGVVRLLLPEEVHLDVQVAGAERLHPGPLADLQLASDLFGDPAGAGAASHRQVHVRVPVGPRQRRVFYVDQRLFFSLLELSSGVFDWKHPPHRFSLLRYRRILTMVIRLNVSSTAKSLGAVQVAQGRGIGEGIAHGIGRISPQHSSKVISENGGISKSGQPRWESSPGPPECESSQLPLRHLARSDFSVVVKLLFETGIFKAHAQDI
ncbi:hypothetical protein PR048_000392 [Dryococelus australis]|uniref:Uncharacterized protein n=1 Tax=Dryococelus australis TaxID=614101 RepID=A0ABQ9IEH2_9NEOP|nr:hypothetical protein PR048_000392 [Dryococelus australis]